MRDIKFRAWNLMGMSEPGTLKELTTFKPDLGGHKILSVTWPEETIFMQYTEHKTINGRELYDLDIVFVENNALEVDESDERYYLVICWIKEWSMFASLHVSEYLNYKSQGIEAIDESMFWTYTLENAEKDFYYAGNVLENSNLLDL